MATEQVQRGLEVNGGGRRRAFGRIGFVACAVLVAGFLLARVLIAIDNARRLGTTDGPIGPLEAVLLGILLGGLCLSALIIFYRVKIVGGLVVSPREVVHAV